MSIPPDVRLSPGRCSGVTHRRQGPPRAEPTQIAHGPLRTESHPVVLTGGLTATWRTAAPTALTILTAIGDVGFPEPAGRLPGWVVPGAQSQRLRSHRADSSVRHRNSEKRYERCPQALDDRTWVSTFFAEFLVPGAAASRTAFLSLLVSLCLSRRHPFCGPRSCFRGSRDAGLLERCLAEGLSKCCG